MSSKDENSMSSGGYSVNVLLLLGLIFSGIAMTAARNKNAANTRNLSIATAVVSAVFAFVMLAPLLASLVVMSESMSLGVGMFLFNGLIFSLLVSSLAKSIQAINRVDDGDFEAADSAATTSFAMYMVILMILVLAFFGAFGVGLMALKQKKK